MVLCVLAAVIVVAFAGYMTRFDHDPRPVDANGSTRVQLDSTVTYGLYGNGDSQCSVTAADGTEATLATPWSNTTVNGHLLFATVEAGISGEYTVTCTTSVAGEDVYFGPAIGAQDVGRSVFLVFAAVCMFIVGVPLTIGGIIWLVVRNSHNRRALQAQAAYPTAGTRL
ncbi:hypothetical protein DRB06_10250 [Actinomyces sp. Z5]|nr:hypothetical protein DRB06_10250 [Actinomyces sp. Z5]